MKEQERNFLFFFCCQSIRRELPVAGPVGCRRVPEFVKPKCETFFKIYKKGLKMVRKWFTMNSSGRKW